MENFFAAATGQHQKGRLDRLVDAAKRFPDIETITNRALEEFLYEWSSAFDYRGVSQTTVDTFANKVAYRLQGLNRLQQNLERRDEKNQVARRLILILLAHEIEHISQSESIQLFTSYGITGVSAAKDMVKQHLMRHNLDDDYKRSRNVVQLMRQGGPASLLHAGRVTSSL